MKELKHFAEENSIMAGYIITCVGSLSRACLRMASHNATDRPRSKTWENQFFEITSLVGTLSADGPHLHISISDVDGTTVGGHLLEGCLIHTTAEIVIGEAKELKLTRSYDEETTYTELKVEQRG
eukprot:GEZU01023347.1.p1 GENE.GEZU01023347.1~~GEZU01023347.1.p1  ORF type:complete len:125 (-),score=20.49 GEZU01023347.1:584-958(-)